jgi:hypothetical protein
VIESINQTQIGNIVTVTVVSSLSAPVYYFWYLDGNFVNETQTPTMVFVPSAQTIITCIDSNDPGFDPIANAPAGFPATRTLFFVRSLDPNIGSYLLQQSENSGAWETIATVHDDPGTWSYQVTTGELDDLSQYAWQVVPVDIYGNTGTPTALANELIVRTPDAPDFTFTFEQGSDQVLFSGA